MVAILFDDASVCMMIQTSMIKTNGKWSYAPTLVLPGGLANVLSSEFHGSKTSIADLQKATLFLWILRVIVASRIVVSLVGRGVYWVLILAWALAGAVSWATSFLICHQFRL
eukprot:scaffold10583_cov290-Chaetoceros_neogracile.AAC.29